MLPVANRLALDVDVIPDRDRVILALSGELDIAATEVLTTTLDDLRSGGWEDIVVDPRGLSFVDSTGLTWLLSADREAREGAWRFSLRDGSPKFARLLQLGGLSEHFRRAEAV